MRACPRGWRRCSQCCALASNSLCPLQAPDLPAKKTNHRCEEGLLALWVQTCCRLSGGSCSPTPGSAVTPANVSLGPCLLGPAGCVPDVTQHGDTGNHPERAPWAVGGCFHNASPSAPAGRAALDFQTSSVPAECAVPTTEGEASNSLFIFPSTPRAVFPP